MIQAAAKERDDAQTNLPVGEILRRARLHYERSITDIEVALRIKASQIEAIENAEFEKLPGRVYAIGFIRSYAEYLGLDGDKMVNLFKAQSGARASKPQLQFPVAASESKLPQAWLVGASIITTLAVIMLWWSVEMNDRSAVTEVPAVPESIKADNDSATFGPPAPSLTQVAAAAPVVADNPTTPNVAATPSTASAPSDPALIKPSTTAAPSDAGLAYAQADQTQGQAAQNANGIILKIVENSWVEIKDSTGKAVVARVLKAGDKYFVPDRPDLSMSLGNSAGVQIEIDGKDLAPLGGQGEVLRNMPLDIKFLKKKYAGALAQPAVNQ